MNLGTPGNTLSALSFFLSLQGGEGKCTLPLSVWEGGISHCYYYLLSGRARIWILPAGGSLHMLPLLPGQPFFLSDLPSLMISALPSGRSIYSSKCISCFPAPPHSSSLLLPVLLLHGEDNRANWATNCLISLFPKILSFRGEGEDLIYPLHSYVLIAYAAPQ